jgi:ZIP family zinc transporter
MSTGQILLLGAIAGLTIFIGLPIGRMHRVSLQTKGFLSAAATGILIFLLWDVLSGAVNPVEQALENGQTGRFAWWATILTLGFSIGLVSLVLYDGWMKRRRRKTFVSVGAAAATDLRRHWFHGMSPGRWLSLFIATGIGLHNFSEGLAIGQSAARDELALAVALIVGFGLHNATEGFGIVAPLAAEEQQPSWSFLGLMGLIAGGALDPGPRARRGVDPLRRDRADPRVPDALLEDDHDLGDPARALRGVRDGLHPGRLRGLT